MAWSDIGNFFKNWHQNGIFTNLWKGFTGQLSQEMVNEQNLEYQRERNEIEDARYTEETAYNRAFAEDERDYERAFQEEQRDYLRGRDALSDARYAEETAYNRAFAEDERDYQRALQQNIFEREDTAIERQANQLSKLGINPLSQQMNGLGSGSVVSSSSAPMAGSQSSNGSVSAPVGDSPASSSRGGKALHADMISPDSMIGPAMELVNSVGNLAGQGIQRDALRLQNQRSKIENLILAAENGIQFDENGNPFYTTGRIPRYTSSDFNEVDYRDKNASANRNERVDKFQDFWSVNDQTPKAILSVPAAAEALTASSQNSATGKKSSDVLRLLETVEKYTGPSLFNSLLPAGTQPAGKLARKGISTVYNKVKDFFSNKKKKVD